MGSTNSKSKVDCWFLMRPSWCEIPFYSQFSVGVYYDIYYLARALIDVCTVWFRHWNLKAVWRWGWHWKNSEAIWVTSSHPWLEAIWPSPSYSEQQQFTTPLTGLSRRIRRSADPLVNPSAGIENKQRQLDRCSSAAIARRCCKHSILPVVKKFHSTRAPADP